MKQWKIEYWDNRGKKNPIEKWLDSLSGEQMRSVVKEISMLEEVGNELMLPHSKPLGQGLFELRERRFGFRIYYCFHGICVIILLAAGDKKTQEGDIRIARERWANVRENENKKL